MYKLCIIICVVLTKYTFASIDYDGRLLLKLYHALDPENKDYFSERGNITIDSTRSGTHFINQVELSLNELQQLKDLANGNGIYRLKCTLGNNEETYLTSVKAQALLAAKLSDSITVNLGHTGSVMAVTLSVPTDASEYDSKQNSHKKFCTLVYIKHMSAAPIPDTASYIQKIEREKEARERGEIKDNRSFLAKYWMYIVPIAIFVLISGAANPEAQTGGR